MKALIASKALFVALTLVGLQGLPASAQADAEACARTYANYVAYNDRVLSWSKQLNGAHGEEIDRIFKKMNLNAHRRDRARDRMYKLGCW